MKVTVFLILALLFRSLLIQDDEVNKEYYPSGNIKSETVMNGSDGWSKKYYESGQLMARISIRNGKMHGPCIIYYSSGKKAFDNKFKNGTEDGIQSEYYLSGKIKSKHEMKNGIPIGSEMDYYESGKTAAIWDYQKDIVIGKTYYETGELFSINKFNDIAFVQMQAFDKGGTPLNGEIKDYFNSGKLQIHGFFHLGIPNGHYRSFYESGKANYCGLFINGKPEGEHRIHNESGNIAWKIPYKKGEIDGIVFYFNPITTELVEKRIYKKGKRIESNNDENK